ncbi:hypothetical protein R1flu_026637 [Riccia fluitans]|uniref:Late embryogenesis abundant protein LEA-2 subgroup domain-containing protein n=1 Tax=Riccia fluitans TaxID=41844 RepID=A0ABD1XGH8_9MARC
MENSKDGSKVEKDLESQEQPINGSPSSNKEAGARSSRRRSVDKKLSEATQAQAEVEDFWSKIYNTMRHVESKEQAETLFKGLSSSKRMVDNTPAKIEAQGEWQSSQEELRKVSEARARQKSHPPETHIDVEVESKTPEMYPFNVNKVDAADEKLLKTKRRKRCCGLCCGPAFWWCLLMIFIPILAVFLVSYFVLLRPKDPTVSLGDVSIDGFNVSTIGTSTTVETAMNFTVTLKNPNRYADVIFEKMDLLLVYRSTSIGSVSVGGIAGYKQEERNSTLIDAQLAKITKPITDAIDAQALQSEAGQGNVKMLLTGVTDGRFKLGGIKLGTFNIPVNCVLNIRPELPNVPAELLSASCYYLPS